MTVRFFAERRFSYRGIALHVSDGIGVARPLTFQTAAEGEWSEPVMVMTDGEAQELMDELWRAGLRPSEGAGSAGSLAATERHLKDMQRIAFMLLPEKQ